MMAIGLHFSSDDVDTPDGTGFMAGYATYVEGTISSDYHHNSCHKVTYTCRQAGFWCTRWCDFAQLIDLWWPQNTSDQINNLGKSYSNVIC